MRSTFYQYQLKSHYIDVVQGGFSSIEQDKLIVNIYQPIFSLKKIQKKFPIYLFIKETLCNFLVQMLQYFFLKQIYFLIMKTWKTPLIIGPKFFFQYCQSAQNQPKSHVLFHKELLLARLLYNDFDQLFLLEKTFFRYFTTKIQHASIENEIYY